MRKRWHPRIGSRRYTSSLQNKMHLEDQSMFKENRQKIRANWKLDLHYLQAGNVALKGTGSIDGTNKHAYRLTESQTQDLCSHLQVSTQNERQ